MSTPSGRAPRSALFAAWTNAWLNGDATLDELVERVSGADDRHEVDGLGPDRLSLSRGVGQLRAQGVARLRLVLPAAGDVLGLPGPGPFSSAALTASEGVLAIRGEGAGFGLVPTVTAHGSAFDGTVTTVVWTAHPVPAPGPDPGPFLHDAEHDLRVGVMHCARALQDLDVARWRPELTDALAGLRHQARTGIGEEELPGGYPSRARELLVRARQLGGVLALAEADPGGAVDSREAAAREVALRDLSRLVRRAHLAAYNAYRAAG